MKNNIYIMICGLGLLFGSFITTGCDKWFDVKSSTDIKEQDLFARENGYFDALVGCYALMSDNALYGKDLSLVYPEIFACNYKITNNHSKYYVAASTYDYLNTNLRPSIDRIWNNMYNAIANVNNLLKRMETADKKIFADDNYNLIKGEALALRAYMHFDLLRLFGSSVAMNKSDKWMPYVAKYGKETTPYSTTDEVLRFVMDDINEAIPLLVNDPGKTVVNSSLNKYLLNRATRLNIHAVKGLRARVALYMGDMDTAYKAAKEAIAQPTYVLVSDPLMCENNKLFGPELMFGLYVDNLAKSADDVFKGGNSFTHDNSVIEEIYDYSVFRNQDVRLEYLFSNADKILRPRKFLQEIADIPTSASRIPMIRLSEMYYIAAEAAPNILEADTLLSRVRTARRLPAIQFADRDELNNYLMKEYRREMYAEGQLFYYYKRRNISQIPNCGETIEGKLDKVYILPIPEQEKEWGNKVSNK